MLYTCMVSRCLSTTYTFNFPDSGPVEVKTVVYILSPADGPLIVLKQTCRRWESKDSWSEELGRQPEWKGREPGDQWRINSAVKPCVTPLCVYFSVEPNTRQDPLIPSFEPNLCGCSHTEWNMPLWECFCLNLELEDSHLLCCLLVSSKSCTKGLRISFIFLI